MELALYLAGIGGQGIQLMAKVLALAALAENRHVMLAGEYGYMMRGGSSLGTVVIGAQALGAIPVIARADAAIILHHQFLDKPVSRLAGDALVLTDTALVDLLPPLPGRTVIAVDAAGIASEIGSPMVAGLALLSAFCATTGLVATESLVAAMVEQVPSYRRQHIENNRRAIELGAARATARHRIDLDARSAA